MHKWMGSLNLIDDEMNENAIFRGRESDPIVLFIGDMDGER